MHTIYYCTWLLFTSGRQQGPACVYSGRWQQPARHYRCGSLLVRHVGNDYELPPISPPTASAPHFPHGIENFRTLQDSNTAESELYRSDVLSWYSSIVPGIIYEGRAVGVGVYTQIIPARILQLTKGLNERNQSIPADALIRTRRLPVSGNTYSTFKYLQDSSRTWGGMGMRKTIKSHKKQLKNWIC